MRGTGAWKRRVFAVATIALSLMMIAPELAPATGAAAGRVQLVAARRTLTHKQKILAVMRARGRAAAAARARAGLPPRTYTSGKTGTTVAGTTKRARTAAGTAAARKARLRRAIAARNARKKTAVAGAGAFTARAAKKKSSSLSLPELALIAIAPFVLMGLYLLGAERLRNPQPRKRRRQRRRRAPSFVITRVGDR